MPRSKSRKLNRSPVVDPSVVATLDLPIMRARLANCVTAACHQLEADIPQLEVEASFFRLEDLSLVFGLTTNVRPARLYRLTLVNPDGTSVNLFRFDEDGEPIEFDDDDQMLVRALSKSLASTVCAAFKHIVQTPCKPTHAAITTLQ